MPIRSYRELLVWQRAMDLVTTAYQISRTLPDEERFGLKQQSRKAVVSVPANIAEGKGRHHLNEYLYHLSIANGSLKEVETHLFVMIRLGYVEEQTVTGAIESSEEVGRMLHGLRKSLQRSAKR